LSGADWRSDADRELFGGDTSPIGKLVEIPEAFVEQYGGPQACPVLSVGHLECPIDGCPHMGVPAVMLEGDIVVVDCPRHRVSYSKVKPRADGDNNLYYLRTQVAINPEALCRSLHGVLGDKTCWILGNPNDTAPHLRFDSREVPSRLSGDTLCLLYGHGLALAVFVLSPSPNEDQDPFACACRKAWWVCRERLSKESWNERP
jgi:hypothetical protein